VKKIFLVIFSLIMMCSVSFGIDSFVEYKSTDYSRYVEMSTPTYFDTYTQNKINTILSLLDEGTSEAEYQTFIDLLEKNNYKYVTFLGSDSNYYMLIQDPNLSSDIIFHYLTLEKDSNTYIGIVSDSGVAWACYLFGPSYGSRFSRDLLCETDNINYISFLGSIDIYESNCDIYKFSLDSNYYWDGVSYSYQPSQTGDNTGGSTEIDLTDEQIAEIVERFINSDAYLEKAYYNGDYFITYDNLTGYFRGYSYSWNIDLAIEYGNYDEEGNFVTTGTTEGEAWRIRPYEFSGDIFVRFGDWLASKFNTYSFEYFSISPDSSIEPRYIGSLEHNYCSNYKENEVVIYSSKQIRYVGEETDEEGNTETVVTDNYIPPTILVDSETGEEIVIRDNLQNSSDSLENIITPNADFSGLKEAFEKYISFVNISSITWLTTAISSMITIFVPFVALGIVLFLINRILNGGS